MFGGVRGSVLGACGRSSIREIENSLTVLLKHLTREDLREEISRIECSRHQLDGHDAGTTHLAHLKQLSIDVPRVLCRGVPVAQVIRPFVVGAGGDGSLAPVAHVLQHSVDVNELDG